MGISAKGFDGLGRDLEKLLDGLSSQSIKKALQNGADPIMKRMIQNAPVGPTGNLKKAIETGRIQQKGGRYFLKIGVIGGTKAPHAYLVEHGHGGPHPAPPHPFMRPAFDATADEAYASVRDTLKSESTKG